MTAAAPGPWKRPVPYVGGPLAGLELPQHGHGAHRGPTELHPGPTRLQPDAAGAYVLERAADGSPRYRWHPDRAAP